jgi:hypothetical protein
LVQSLGKTFPSRKISFCVVLDALWCLALSGLALSRDGGLFSKLRHGVKAVWVAVSVQITYNCTSFKSQMQTGVQDYGD